MDNDFYFPDATYKNLVALAAWLLDEFSIPLTNLIMHHQITGKLCPAMWCNSKDAINQWNLFKSDVAQVLNKAPTADDLPAPTGASSESGGTEGTISVKKGTPYYMDAEGTVMLGYISSDKSLKYTAKNSFRKRHKQAPFLLSKLLKRCEMAIVCQFLL